MKQSLKKQTLLYGGSRMYYPDNWEKVTCYDWYENEKKVWLCLGNKNAICEIDKSSRNIKILGSFPHNGPGDSRLSLAVGKYENYIIFCPFKANDIALLNTSTGKLEFIDLLSFIEKNSYIDRGTEKFYRMFFYKRNIYFFGIKCPVIMRLDLKTKHIDFFDGWQEQIEKHKCKDGVFFTDGYAQKKNELYLPIGKCSGLLKINLDTMIWDYIELEFAMRGILGMTQKENLVWLTEQNIEAGYFLQWNLDNGKFIQIDLPCRDAFYKPLYYKNTLLFFQNYRNKSYRYEIESGKWEEITQPELELGNTSDKKKRGEEIDYFSSESGKFYHWNSQTNVLYYDEFRIKEKEFLTDSWLGYCNLIKQTVMTEKDLGFKDYLDVITEPANVDLFEKRDVQKAEQIWKYLMLNER